ncbi:MAG TPA: M20 family peptidase [Gemmatimonadaceae bacterium]|nr:M20 family peptidase [Gemmatimonadaceae bacterium]
MKRLALLALLVVLTLAAVALVRTIRFAPAAGISVAGDSIAIDDSAAAARLARALRFRTISYLDSGVNAAEMLGLHAYLDSAFPRVHAALKREVVGGYSLLYTWRGSDTSAPPLILMSHMDVVPVEAGTEAGWAHPPFAGDIADGFVWGRGSLDDKVGVLAILEGVETILARGIKPNRTIYLAFGEDEEVRGSGARAIVSLLASRGVHPNFVMDEGGVVAHDLVPGVSRPVALVGVAEKGYASVDLTVRDAGGHSSMPPPHTAVGVLSSAIVRVEANQMPARIAGATAVMFDRVAREMSFGSRFVFANRWLFEPLIVRQLSASPSTNATIRTTTAATMFEGSVKDNVLPQRARAVVNFRILPGDSVAGVLAHVRDVVRDPRVTVALHSTSNEEPSPTSPTEGEPYQLLETAIAQRFPGTIIAPVLVTGATDARYYAALTPNVYRFLPLPLSPSDLSRIHGTNERVGVADYGRAVRFMTQLILDETR